MCREEAVNLWAMKSQFDELGVSLTCLLHENLPKEVEEFREYWPGPLYLDEEKAFYKWLGGGKPRQGSLMAFLNPFSEVWGHAKRASTKVAKSNLKGDGLTMGGLLVLNKGIVGYHFIEKTFGVHAPIDDVVAAASDAPKWGK